MTAAPAYVDLTKQVRRSIALLEIALSTLREEPISDNRSLADIADRVEQVKAKLVSSVDLKYPAYKECLVESHTMLDEALKFALSLTGLSSRQTQSLTTIERAYAILLPVVNRRSSAHPRRVSGPHLRGERVSQTPGGQQRRRHDRVELETEVTLDGLTNFYTGFSEDISNGGLFVSTYDIRPIGTDVEVSFSLPSGHIVNARGQVRWLYDPVEPEEDSSPGMGISFEALLPEDRVAVEEFIKSRAPIFFDE
jgi:uncharacterized protein (TIGR02266 family)